MFHYGNHTAVNAMLIMGYKESVMFEGLFTNLSGLALAKIRLKSGASRESHQLATSGSPIGKDHYVD